MQLRDVSSAVLAAALIFSAPAGASAAPFVVGLADFVAAPNATLTTFETVATGTDANGLRDNGLTITYLGIGGAIVGPSAETTNVSGQTLTPFDPNAAFQVTFDDPVLAFGTGFALISTAGDDVLSIELFRGTTSLGSLAFDSTVDPNVLGVAEGFAGVGNADAFDRVVITFLDPNAFAVALDNLRTIPATIPEPATVTLVALGLLAAARRRARH